MDVPKRSFLNSYLDAPIIEGEMLKCYAEVCELREGGEVRRQRSLSRWLMSTVTPEWDLHCYTPRQLPIIIATLNTHQKNTGLSEAWRIAEKVWEQAANGLQAINPSLVLPAVPAKAPACMREYLSRAEIWVRFVEGLTAGKAKGIRGICKEEEPNMILAGDQYCCALVYPQGTTAYILPYEQVLAIKDILLMRANVHFAVSLIYPSLLEAGKIVERVFFWQEECLYRYGNEGYEVLKQLEPITKAFVIHSQDPLLGQSDSDVLSRLRDLVVVKEREHGGRSDFQVDDLISILAAAPSLPLLVELFGLQRTCGHPLIDPSFGGASAAHEASRPMRTLFSSGRELRNNWCRMYLEGFVHRSGQWPPLSFTAPGRQTQLYQLYKVRDRAIRKESYPLADWEHAKFLPHQEFDYYTNFTDLMDDKSISYYRDEFRATWDTTIKPRSQKRLLLEMLGREEISVREVIGAIERREVPPEWFIVSLYPKEREFKLAARMFSMMVFEMRMFFSCLEANLADHIFPNLPQQTMTLSKTEILERFFHLSKPSLIAARQRLFIEIDLSRWNLRWRDMLIRMIGMDLDDIFGTNGRYTFVHEFFRRSLIVVRVAGYPPPGWETPNPPESSLLWTGHEGGFEGISQKHWTIPTYSMIDLGVKPFDLEYSLVGQADNQVILATVNVPPGRDVSVYLRDLAAQIKESVATSCAEVGQEAKEEECLESSCVVTYSKDFYIHGCEYHLSLKALSRVFPHGASDFPTISNGVASITAACVAAAERMKQPILAYFAALVHVARFLIRVRTRPMVENAALPRVSSERLTEKTIVKILTLPGSLGGMSVPAVCTFLYKGGGDSLSKDYMSLKVLHLGGSLVAAQINEALLSKAWMPSVVKREQLLEDPYAIPMRRMATAENRVLSTSLAHMIKKTKNKALRSLIDVPVAAYEVELSHSLLAVTPFNPVFLADVLSCSIVGARRATMKMFTATRTIQSLTSAAETDPGGMILQSSASEFRELLRKLTHLPPTRRSFGSVYDSVETLRSFWKTQDADPDIVGVTSYIPLDWEVLTDASVDSQEGVLVTYSPSPDPWYIRGAEVPYLGTDTKEKRTRHGYKIIASSAAEKAYARLANIATQPGVEGSFVSLIAAVARTRSPIALEALLPHLSRAVGGSIAHRYQSVLGNRGASALGCGTFASHLVINSDYSGALSASLEDYPIMFQEEFSLLISLLNIIVQDTPEMCHYIRVRTPRRLMALPSEAVTAKYAPQAALVYPDNPIAYSADISLIRVARPMDTVLMSNVTTASLVDLTPSRIGYQAAYRQLLNRHTAHLIADRGFGAVRLPLDLLEYRGIGLARVVAGVTMAIGRFAVDALFSRGNDDIRYTPLPTITSLAEGFAPHLLKAAAHPLFSDDPTACLYLPPSDMTYSRSHSHRTVVGLLVSQTLRHLDNLEGATMDLVEFVFDDDAEDTPLLRAESLMKRIVLRAVARDEISPREAYLIARTNLVQATRMAETAAGKLGGVHMLATVMSTWAAQQVKPGLAYDLEQLASGALIRRVFRPLPAILRALRGRATSTRLTHSLVPEGGAPVFLSLSTTNEQPVDSVNSWSHKVSYEDPNYIRFNLRRRYFRVHGQAAPAVYSFWSLRSLFCRQNVVILGSGNGGVRKVALGARASTIVCHDLRADVANRAIARGSYKEGESVVVRSLAGYHSGSCTGDLEEKATWDELCNHLVGYRVIVLDIPTNWAKFQTITSHLCAFAPGSLLVSRWFLSDYDTALFFPTFSKVPGHVGVVPVWHSDGYWEVLVVTRVEWSGAWVAYHGDVQVGKGPTLPDYEGIRAMGGGYEWNCITYRGYTPDVWAKAEALSIAALGKERNTFTHDQWTRVLRFHAGRYLDKEVDWVETIVSWHRSDVIHITLGEEPFPVAMTPSLRRWLLTDYPRTRAR